MTTPPSTPVGPTYPMPFAHAPVNQLVSIWLEQLDTIRDLAQELTPQQWAAESPCPGWTVGDVVAHVLALESEMHGAPLPDHEPDWAALPHITTDFGKLTERAVDWYRSKDQEVVVAELIEMTAWRHDDLAQTPDDPAEVITGALGMQLPRDQMIRTRILDTWVHEQDIRTAIGRTGGLGSDAAWVCAGQFIATLPFVWGKRLGAATGSTLDLTVSGPGVSFERIVGINPQGRAEFRSTLEEAPTLSIVLDWPTYAAGAAGRLAPDTAADLDTAAREGDLELAQRLVAALAITP